MVVVVLKIKTLTYLSTFVSYKSNFSISIPLRK